MILPFAQRICNAEAISSIGVAPALIIFGGAINLDRGLLVPNLDISTHVAAVHPPMTAYVQNLVEAQRYAMDYARSIQDGLGAYDVDGRGYHRVSNRIVCNS